MPTTYTPNLNLAKPDGGVAGDFVDVTVLNANADKLDALIAGFVLKKVADQALADQVSTDVSTLQFNIPSTGNWELDFLFHITAIDTGGAGQAFDMTPFFPATSFAAMFGMGDNTGSAQIVSGTPYTDVVKIHTDNLLAYKILLTATATGLVKLQLRNSVAGHIITVKTGSILTARKLV
jgi:hypothetical protein